MSSHGMAPELKTFVSVAMITAMLVAILGGVRLTINNGSQPGYSSKSDANAAPTSSEVTPTPGDSILKQGWSRLEGTTLPFLPNASIVGPVNLSQQIFVTFYLRDSWNESAFTALVDWEKSEAISPGVTECPVSASANSSGTYTTSQSCFVDLSKTNMTIEEAETLFSITMNIYLYQGHTFFANSDDPAMPSRITASLIAIEGLNDYPQIGTLG